MSAVVEVQKAHAAWPVADVVTVPGAHARHDARDEAPGSAEKVLSGQGTHTALELAPTAEDQVPAGHATQLVALERGW